MDGVRAAQELDRIYDRLDPDVEQIRQDASDYAKAEAEYRIELRKEMLAARREGVAWSAMSDLCRGVPRIAELKRRRDELRELLKASHEALNVDKLKTRILQSAIDKDWSIQGGRYEY